MKLKHYIITRINVGYLNNPIIKNIDIWFYKRLELTKQYCLPSIKNQHCKDFTWFWCIDPRTSIKHKKQIENLAKSFLNIRIINKKYIDIINEDIEKDPTISHILTTRLDSDDILGIDFVEKLQKIVYKHVFTIQLPFIINFSIGIYHYSDTDKSFKGSKKFVNQFVSFFEKAKNIKTVHCQEHGKLDAFFPMIWIPTKNPIWAWLIHDEQISTKRPHEHYLGMLRFPTELKNFNIKDFIRGKYAN